MLAQIYHCVEGGGHLCFLPVLKAKGSAFFVVAFIKCILLNYQHPFIVLLKHRKILAAIEREFAEKMKADKKSTQSPLSLEKMLLSELGSKGSNTQVVIKTAILLSPRPISLP